jgi:hypothetical protein
LLFLYYFLRVAPSATIPSIRAILWFSIGAFFALSGKNIFQVDKIGFISTILYALFVSADMILGMDLESAVHKTGVIFGVVFIFFLSGKLVKLKAISQVLQNASSACFFIFATHVFCFKLINLFLRRGMFPTFNIPPLVLFFLLPTLVIIFLVFLYKILMKFFPKSFKVITGGR